MGKRKSTATNGQSATEEKPKRTRRSGDDALITSLSKRINTLEKKLQPVEDVDALRAELEATVAYRATLIAKKGAATLSAALLANAASQVGDVDSEVDEAFKEAEAS